MNVEIILSCISLLGTLVGSMGGILVSSRLTSYRIEQLEKKVNEHNKVIERTYKLEGQMLEVQHDIRDMKNQ
ncbi:hypothetical protein ACTQ34_07900 [Agathobaculum sp. LCP25S3_E8]|uniref:hypothetical protein n=1 Tax=Agathobaculum sp. LCP25S3_E8 TaxID=3438735 RepID=UPI003F93A0C5